MNYKESISHHLRALANHGYTQREIARMLGFRSANLISMHMDPTHPIAPWPLARLPALEKVCGLTALQSARLFYARAKHHPNSATCIDQPTLHWINKRAAQAAQALKASKSVSTTAVGPHHEH